jgi:hypothetical protein
MMPSVFESWRWRAMGVLAIFLAACNEQPSGRDFAEAAPAMETDAAPPAAPNSAPTADTKTSASSALAQARVPKPVLTGQTFSDARSKLQPGMHFAFAMEQVQANDNWQGSGKTNGRSWFYAWRTSEAAMAGEWLVSGSSALMRAKPETEFAKRAFAPAVHSTLQQALSMIPDDASSLQRGQDDFADGRACAVYTLQSSEGTLKLWLDERKAEFRKLQLMQPQREVSIELRDINAPQFLPTVAARTPR